MIFEVHDGEITLDDEGIDWLQQGLETLRECEPGDRVTTPSLDTDPETGEPEGVSEFVLVRA